MEILTICSKNIIRVIVLLVLLGLLPSEILRAQPTCQPTSSGSNSIEFDSVTNEYLFKVDGKTLYKYSINDGPFCYQTGATLFGLKAVSVNNHDFWPSYVGGIQALYERDTISPGDNLHVRYKRLEYSDNGQIVTTRWRMKYFKYNTDITNPAPTEPTDSIDYTYHLRVSGKTLIIQVEVDSQYIKAQAFSYNFNQSECENNYGLEARRIPVPYLTLFNLLYYDATYTSLFVDWETTNASKLVTSNGLRVKYQGI